MITQGWSPRAIFRRFRRAQTEIPAETKNPKSAGGGEINTKPSPKAAVNSTGSQEVQRLDKGTQLVLMNQYRHMAHMGIPLPSFEEAALKVYSQNGEDGVLLLVFAIIGATNRRCIEICAGNGEECNTANLLINFGWEGLLFDGNPNRAEEGRAFFASTRETRYWPPKFVNAWITRESIDALIRTNGFSGPIDLLSLDIDGNDYWIWEAIECVQPRAVILEYQKAWGTESYTQEYDPSFVWRPNATPHGLCGASLSAFVKLGRRKGYRLVGSHRSLNAVFLRDGVGEDHFPETSVESCLDHACVRFAVDRLKRIDAQTPIEGWIEV